MKLLKSNIIRQLTIISFLCGVMFSAVASEVMDEMRVSAERGDPFSQFVVGIGYENGNGDATRADYSKAVYWYERAASQEEKYPKDIWVTSAQYSLAELYYEGINVKQNYPVAAKWFQKSAVRGHPSANFYLGVMYHGGKGVRQNYPHAFKLFQTAANLNVAEAQNNIGSMYDNGEGVRQDKVKAKEWYGKACDNGIQIGCDNYRKLNEK